MGSGDPLDRPGDSAGQRLQPLRSFKRSSDPALAGKVEDLVGLYMHPPMHTMVLSIDETSQIQALDRTPPGLPLKPGKCSTMSHDDQRNGATILFVALNGQDSTALGRCMSQHRHQGFVRLLNAVERAVPAGKLIHAIADNSATHAGCSMSHRPQPPGSRPSRASSQR
ncbi:hypothetical protein SAMN02927895_02296 [Belnapia rosea]|nr:hypothetical protein SAMN02927895_02296 [Belnapia rosea]